MQHIYTMHKTILFETLFWPDFYGHLWEIPQNLGIYGHTHFTPLALNNSNMHTTHKHLTAH